ncbi:MAG: hypothetical protein H7A23_00970 [Leptospiraceae bacterium]|nr:hypothetical protein [Leptospiraceae bacterium]MCP5493102.1 hypothetical protein [Leptospiraceae bacterium]
MRPLFINFLNDKRTYQVNQKFWKLAICKLASKLNGKHFFYNDNFVNGESFLDGNPIYSIYYNDLKKSVRIIQEEFEGDKLRISAWLEKKELANQEMYDELVIDLELSVESKKLALDLIENWILKDAIPTNMEEYIQNLVA